MCLPSAYATDFEDHRVDYFQESFEAVGLQRVENEKHVLRQALPRTLETTVDYINNTKEPCTMKATKTG